jgi:hypothetical protein
MSTSCRYRQSERCLHHFVSHPAKEEGIGLIEALGRVTMQVFVREHCTMIAAPVQSDVPGPKPFAMVAACTVGSQLKRIIHQQLIGSGLQVPL